MSTVRSVPLKMLMPDGTPNLDPSRHPEEIFDLYSIPAFDRGAPDVLAGAEIGSTKQVVQPGDILLSKIVPHIRRAWVVRNGTGRRIIASSEWIVFRSDRVDPAYLRHMLVADQFHSQLMGTVSGVGGSLLRARPKYVERIEIPLPPLPEQRRIATVLDRAEALRAKRRTVLAQLDELRQAIFLEMFGDPVANPKGWILTDVGDTADVQGGLQVTSSRRKNPKEVPYLRVANVFRGYLDLGEIKTLRVTDAEFTRTRLQADDLLIVEGHGNPDEIGRAALWDGSIEGCVHQNHLIRVRFDPRPIHPVFGCEYLNSPGGRRHLLRAGKTTSGLNTISTSEVRSTPIAVPSPELQREFARRAAAVERLKAAQRASLAELDALFASLQHRAFRGEL